MIKKNVLYVEKDLDLKEMMKLYLETEGYNCALSSNADEAIGILGQESFDVIMTSLPARESLKLHTWSRAQLTPQQPFLVLCSYGPDTIKMVHSDENTYLVIKPFKMIDILKLISAGN